MKATLLFLILLFVQTLPIYCVNHMDLIQTMYGEFAGSEFGFNMASLDFNGDGHDDLVVSSSAWNPSGVYSEPNLFGKLYFYWGGPSFDNVPDLVIPGTHYLHYYCQSLFNAGDVNEDGHDDLVIASTDSLNRSTVEIYYGSTSPHITPDVILLYPLALTQYVYAYPIGDINGDHHADLGFLFSGDQDRRGRRLLLLTNINEQPTLFYETDNYIGSPLLSGIGDVNNDGYDDFFMHIPIPGLGGYDMRLVLYYGNTTYPEIDSLIISNNTNQVVTDWGSKVGDVNNDGFADFVAYNNHLWLGSNNLTANWNMTLNTIYGYSESKLHYPFQYGDFNNDGYDDIINTNHLYGWWSGVASIWLGGSQMNGTQDMHLFPPLDYEDRNFGWAKAVGDFNADGFDDVAISAPWWGQHDDQNQTGRVFIYAGNAQLADTTVGNEDENLSTPDVSKWEIKLSPNPMTNHTTKLNVKFLGDGYKHTDSIKIEIYDIKGRKIISKSISHNSLKEGNWDVTLKGIKPGIYILNVYKSNNNVSSSKFTIK